MKILNKLIERPFSIGGLILQVILLASLGLQLYEHDILHFDLHLVLG